MKIALFSDVHANLPALDASLEDIDRRKPDVVYCLGDLVGYNTYPNEVIEEVRRRGIPVIAGNYDYGIGRGSNDCGCAYKTDEEKEMGKMSIAYTSSTIKVCSCYSCTGAQGRSMNTFLKTGRSRTCFE